MFSITTSKTQNHLCYVHNIAGFVSICQGEIDMTQRKLKNTAHSNSELHSINQGLEKYFNHYWSFIEARNPKHYDGKKPNWRTETSFSLNNKTLLRRFIDPDSLVGVRFDTNKGSLVNYCLIDIDTLGKVHPAEYPDTFQKLLDTFEEEGLVCPVFVLSSYSRGLHIFFALSEAVDTFNLACLIKRVVERAGIKIKDGNLELFPNCKFFNKNKVTNYKAHRLPLQPNSGSLLLNDELEPESDHFLDFIAHMDFSARKNIVDEEFHGKLLMARESVEKERFGFFNVRNKSKVAKWKADLEISIKLGWTGTKQTNELLRIIATYGVVFLGLEGDNLYQYVLATVLNATGYTEYCNHHDDIERRCRERAKNAEKYYWKLGSTPKREIAWKDAFDEIRSGVVNGNENTKLNTMQRLKAVLEEIKQALEFVPTTKTAFLKFLIDKSKEIFQVGFSHDTLKQPAYKALWLPVLTLVIESSIAITPAETIATEPKIETPVEEVAVVETVIETQLEAPEIVIEEAEKEEQKPVLDIEPKIPQNPIKLGNYTPLPKTTKSESPESLQNKQLHTLSYMKVFEDDFKNKKNLSGDLGQPERSPKTTSSQSKSKPKLKSKNLQTSPSAEEYYQRLQQRHSEIKQLEEERKTPEYQKTAKEAFERVRAILTRVEAKSVHCTPSPPLNF
ncbi:MAG: hypothetical protein RLZZ04_2007 [Cyanobacteriota bacterium]